MVYEILIKSPPDIKPARYSLHFTSPASWHLSLLWSPLSEALPSKSYMPALGGPLLILCSRAFRYFLIEKSFNSDADLYLFCSLYTHPLTQSYRVVYFVGVNETIVSAHGQQEHNAIWQLHCLISLLVSGLINKSQIWFNHDWENLPYLCRDLKTHIENKLQACFPPYCVFFSDLTNLNFYTFTKMYKIWRHVFLLERRVTL